MNWSKTFVEWWGGGVPHLSVVFTWDLPAARQRAEVLSRQGYVVRAGGPAVVLMPKYMVDVADCSGTISALPFHNPMATFTSRGCVRTCAFCAVPHIEGGLKELDDWPVRPIVCDNNLLACSRGHFDRVVDRLKPLAGIDFNQGLDARLLTTYHAERLAELDCMVRLAFDSVAYETQFREAYKRLRVAGFPKRRLRVYVLIGFKDTPADALYRLRVVHKELKLMPNPMRYQSLDSLKKNGSRIARMDP